MTMYVDYRLSVVRKASALYHQSHLHRCADPCFIGNILMSVVDLDLCVCEPGSGPSGPSGPGGAESAIEVFNLKHEDRKLHLLTLMSFDGIKALVSRVAVATEPPLCTRMHAATEPIHNFKL